MCLLAGAAAALEGLEPPFSRLLVGPCAHATARTSDAVSKHDSNTCGLRAALLSGAVRGRGSSPRGLRCALLRQQTWQQPLWASGCLTHSCAAEDAGMQWRLLCLVDTAASSLDMPEACCSIKRVLGVIASSSKHAASALALGERG